MRRKITLALLIPVCAATERAVTRYRHLRRYVSQRGTMPTICIHGSEKSRPDKSRL